MKRTIIPVILSFFVFALAEALTPSQATASNPCPLSAQQASQILGYAVEPKDLGVLGCNYAGKRGLATLMMHAYTNPADAERGVARGRARMAMAPARVSLAYGSKGATFVQVIVQPKDPRAASAFLEAVLAKL